MEKRKLGKTGIEVSEIAFGTVSLGLPYGIGMKNHEDMLPEAEAVKLLQTALDNGINFYDTARSYGCSEEIIGKAFKGKQDDVVISTKSNHFLDENGQVYSKNKLKETVNESLEKSLSVLGMDYIDLYMSHTGTEEVINNHDVMYLMAKYKKQGLVKSVGISTYTPKETIQAIENDVWDVVQLPFNLMDQRHGEFFNLAAQNGTAIVVRSALFKGILTEKGQNLHPALKSVEEHRNAYKLLSEKTGLNLSDLATKFVLSYNQVSSVLVGIDRMQYLQKALYVADGKYFDRNLLSEIQDLAYPEPEFLNLRKWNSKGWLK